MIRFPLAGVSIAAVIIVSLAGCCTSPPLAEKYFDRGRSPEEAVRMFRYAVEAKQYGAAYRCLTTRFREDHSESELALAIRFGSWDGKGIRALIVDAQQDTTPPSEVVQGFRVDEAAWVTLVSIDDPDDLASSFQELSLFVWFEDGEWRVDPDRSDRPGLESFFGEFSSAP